MLLWQFGVLDTEMPHEKKGEFYRRAVLWPGEKKSHRRKEDIFLFSLRGICPGNGVQASICIFSWNLYHYLRTGMETAFPCGITEKASGTDINLDGWLFCFYLTYYVCSSRILSDCSFSTAFWSAPVSTAAAATRADRPFSSHNGSSRSSVWYVEPVLSAPSWKIQSSAEMPSVLQIW